MLSYITQGHQSLYAGKILYLFSLGEGKTEKRGSLTPHEISKITRGEKGSTIINMQPSKYINCSIKNKKLIS